MRIALSVLLTHLDVFLVFQQRSFHDIPEQKVLWFYVKFVSCDIGYSVPVSILHGFVGHQLQKRAALVEVVNLFLQFVERLPLLQSFGQLATSEALPKLQHVLILRQAC